MFIGLHRHSHYSKRDAIAKVPDIVNRIGELGQSAWALTDHGTTSGLMEAYKATQKYNKAHNTNIKFIFGCEAYWIPNYYIKDRKQSCHIILLAKNKVGYRNLLKLVTIGYGNKGKSPDNYFYTMRLTTEDIAKHKDGLIVTSACMGGILNPMVEDVWDRELAYERAKTFRAIFGSDFYLEIQCATDERQKQYNKNILEMGKNLDIPVFVSEDSHYVNKNEANIHRKWLGVDLVPSFEEWKTSISSCEGAEGGSNAKGIESYSREKIDTLKRLTDGQLFDVYNKIVEQAYYQTDDYFIHSEDEVREALNYLSQSTIDELIGNTVKVSEKCEAISLDFGGKNFPVLDLDGKTPLDVVKQKCRDGWKKKMVNVPREKWGIYTEQLKHEFDILEKCDYLNYFIMTEDFISACRRKGIRMGIGRGSVGGCLVAYLMDITRIDPIKFNLIFERFAHDKRVSLPDM